MLTKINTVLNFLQVLLEMFKLQNAKSKFYIFNKVVECRTYDTIKNTDKRQSFMQEKLDLGSCLALYWPYNYFGTLLGFEIACLLYAA